MAPASALSNNTEISAAADVEIHQHAPAVKRAVRFQDVPMEDELSDPESSSGSSSSGRVVSDIELFGSESDDLEQDSFNTMQGVEIGHGYGGQMPKAQGLYLPEEEKDACGVGFIVHQKGVPSHKIVSDAKSLLCNMTHRGSTGADSRDGDGAGIMCGMPDDFMRREMDRDLGIVLPAAGEYAVGNVFFKPHDAPKLEQQKDIFTKIANSLGLRVLGWREVPKDNTILGPAALSREPVMLQPAVVLARSYGTGSKPGQGVKEGDEPFDRDYFDRQLYVLRKHATHTITLAEWFYICSLSAQVIVYKGQLSPVQVYNYYHDLNHARFSSHFCLVHSRFSTNTFPSWSRAQPMRWAAHNGEINTVRGNKNWMRAREGNLFSEKFGDELDMLYPIIEEGGSDSAAFDNVLELLVVNNVLTLPEAVMMMVPEAWQDNKDMEPEKVAFYQWAACLMEPWDGPALFAFSDGRYCGANLDRNGLRPCRWITTDDDLMICASEVGTIYIAPEKVTRKGRLQPGKMLLVDTREGRIVDDKELKMTCAKKAPFAEWYQAQMLKLPVIMQQERKLGDDLEIHLDEYPVGSDPKLLAFGYSFEQMDLLMRPMVTDGKEALGSMGNDTALACMTTQARVIYDYFRQLFAQVTNPPIDPIREAIVMSLECYVGAEGNLLDREPKQCRRLLLPSPVLSIEELHALQHLKEVYPTWPSATLDLTFEKSEGLGGYEATIDKLCKEASKAVDEKYRVVILSDRNMSADRVPVSAAAACGAVHHYLVRTKQRSKIALIIETGEAREVHHICVLVGYGADGVCPYLIMEAMLKLRREGLLKTEMTGEQIIKNYQHATDNGILKVMSKMGISTLHSYKGAQIFEALGLHKDVIDKCFSGTASRIQGATFELLAMDAFELHERGYPSGNVVIPPGLPETGEYHWREGGESHINDPVGIAQLQDAVRTKNQSAYDAYAANARQQVKTVTLRGLLDFDFSNSTPIDIEEVEPWHEIVKRFCTGAMSYGSISMEAHSTLAVAMNRLGGKSNTGEGGEDAERSQILPNGDTQRSSIKQIASGRFGVTSNYLADADELQIKMAQGAKPGEGGELPGHKVSESIGKTRHSTPGVGLISPPPHHDIYSIEDLKQLIYDLKCSNPRSRVSVKLVSEVGVGIVASGVAKARADHILISGHDGGTGAARWTSVKYAGLPWELGLAETHQTLVLNDLRGRVTVQTDGNLRTGRDVAIACLLGAEEWGFATVPLIAMGCIMMRKCHLNTCPVGIATQDPELRAKFAGQPEQIINFFFYLAEELRGIMAKFGFRTINEMVGHAELLKVDESARTGKTTHLDLSPILKPAWKMRPGAATYKVRQQDHRLYVRLDNKFIDESENAINKGEPVKIECEVVNTDRALATTLSNKVSKKYGEAGLPKDTIHINMRGSAGQSLGAFMAPGITVELEGDANDYVGKGLSGGRLIVYPPRVSNFKSEDNIIVGNVCLYGATSGEAYFRGIAAERFAVRNSGAYAVCEGVGDHGCEYMTGGRVVILGSTGRNFAAGMSGGIAYVLDTADEFSGKCNKESVELEPLSDEEEITAVRTMIENHKHYTGSEIAARVLDDFKTYLPKIIRVMPSDYKAVLEKQAGKASKEARANHNGFDIATDGYAPEEDKATKKANGVEEIPAAKPVKQEPAVVDLEDSMVDGEKEKKRSAAALDKTRGFMKYKQLKESYRSPKTRTSDWKELSTRLTKDELRVQSARCMDCGVPFCQSASSGGCPLGNLIPRWNDLVFKGQESFEWKDAYHKLAATNNLPEVTGRVCPAPCQESCVLGINSAPVGIKTIEAAIIDNAWEEGWVVPRPPAVRTGKKVAIIGSGPAGIAAADQLNKAGHQVRVYERSDRVGGLLMYGIPNMKLDKELVLQRRINLLAAEGIEFITGAHVGVDPAFSAEKIRSENDAVIMATGATFPRDLRIDGREAKGVHFAMEFLQQNTKSLLDSKLENGDFISAKDKHVLVIGGGDTGNDCIGTSIRHGAKSVTNFELLPQPPNTRAADNPWPQWSKVFRVDYGHTEVADRFGKDPREYSISTKAFKQNAEGHVTAVTTIRVEWTKDAKGAWKMAEVPGSEQEFKADLILLALGFLGPETAAVKQLGLEQDPRSNIKTATVTPKLRFETAVPGIYATGDCRRGQSLVVWAISEGRECAAQVDTFLSSGGNTQLPVAGSIKLRSWKKATQAQAPAVAAVA